jgi:hypothetical protein
MKKLLKIKEVAIKKLFYKKWLFKIVVECGGISSLHRKGVEYVRDVQPIFSSNTWARASIDHVVQNRKDLIHIASTLENLLTIDKYQIRAEGSSCAIFTNSELLVNKIKVYLTNFVTEIHRPANDIQATFLSCNKNKVLCNDLPLEGYRYKVYFKNGDVVKSDMSKFLQWADRFKDGRIYIPRGTRRILAGETYAYFYGHYFYAKDQKMVSMALLVMGDHLNKSEEFVLKSEVNA